MRIVVVGAGLGGLYVVEELRRGGHAGPLALVGTELEHPYDRPPLSKATLRDGAPPAHLRPVADYAELGIDLRLGRTAVRVDDGAVTLDDGDTLAYDALVLAPGAAPRRLRDVPAGHVLRTHADALALRAAVLQAGRLLVVGGGFVGCEAAASARALGAEVDLVEVLRGPLVRVLGPQVAARVTALHESHGVRLHGGVHVTAHRDDVAVLSDGTRLAAPVVLLGLGVVPATGWLDGRLELAPDGGIVCSPSGRTSQRRVWALGDAAAWAGRRTEHWTSAVEQAAVVADDVLTGAVPEAAPVPYVWSEQHGSLLQLLGDVQPSTETETHPVGAGVVALHTEADRLTGLVCVDAKKQVARGRRLLRDGADLATAREVLLR